MRRELILDAGIAETNDQFHAAIPKPCRGEPRRARWTAEGGCPHMVLFFLLLLSFLLALLRSRFPFSPSLCLPLLNNLRLSWSRPRLSSHRFRRCHNFFLHAGNV